MACADLYATVTCKEARVQLRYARVRVPSPAAGPIDRQIERHMCFHNNTWIVSFFRKHRVCLDGATCSTTLEGELQQPGSLPIFQAYMASSGSLPLLTLPVCSRGS